MKSAGPQKRRSKVGMNVPASVVRSASVAVSGSTRPTALPRGKSAMTLRNRSVVDARVKTKNRALNMRFSIATVGNAHRPTVESFRSRRSARISEADAAALSLENHLRALIVPYVNNLTIKEDHADELAEEVNAKAVDDGDDEWHDAVDFSSGDLPAPSPSPKPRPFKGLSIEGRSLVVEEEARLLDATELSHMDAQSRGLDLSANQYRLQATVQQGVSTPVFQRVLGNGFFGFAPGELSNTPNSVEGKDEESADDMLGHKPRKKFTGLAIRSESLVVRAPLQTGQYHGNSVYGSFVDTGAKHHIFLPVVRELK